MDFDLNAFEDSFSDAFDVRVDEAELPVVDPGDSFPSGICALMNTYRLNFNSKEGIQANNAISKNVEYVFGVLEKAHKQEGMYEYLNAVALKLKALNCNVDKFAPKPFKGTGLNSVIEGYDVEKGFRYANHAFSLYSALTVNKATIKEAIS